MQILRSFLQMCTAIGVPIAADKTFPAHTTITFVGISLDSLCMECSLPDDKLSKAKDLLSNFSADNLAR